MSKSFFAFIAIFIIISPVSIYSQESWTSTDTSNSPSARVWQTAIWTGSKMIIWGGNYYNSGGVYDPVSNTWSATSTVNAPQGRGTHSAVWTGSKMIIWGGSAVIIFGTGGQYDPVSNQWTATSTINAPEARHFHSVVWTGSKMIIWGGETNGTVTNTGGIYDPVADNWISTSTVNAPVARYLHTGTWTGSRLIVWGGGSSSGLTLYNTGGIFDPLSNSWAATSLDNAPIPRCAHVAVWTGSKIIIWGGVTGTLQYTNTGGIYDPQTNSWTAISTVNAPEARSYHTGIWTGSKLVVWGGNGSNYQVNSGAIYDPLTDSWSSMSLVNAPEQREYQSAVWTGNKLIVWGGMHLGVDLKTGGVYSNNSIIGIRQEGQSIPDNYSLSQNYPNPFNPSTTISFSIPVRPRQDGAQRETPPSRGAASDVKLIIFDVAGKVVETLINQQMQPGKYSVNWDGLNNPSGVYFYQLSINNEQIATKKMVLLK